MKHFFLLMILLLIQMTVSAQDASLNSDSSITSLSLDEILRNVDADLRGERYESAIRLLLEGQGMYDDPVLHEKLGDIYFDQEFYEPALDEYYAINEPEQHVLLRIAESYRRLNRDQEAVRAFEIYLNEYPSDLTAVSDYGWVLYKVDQYSKGINYIRSYTDNGFADTALLMTLGTLYSGLYDLENSKKYYMESIELAKSRGYIQTQAIGYYNLAIIENEFDEYTDALAHAEKSLDLLPRYSAYLQMGDFTWQKGEYKKTADFYEEAYKTDETKFSLLSLLELCIQTGQLEQAFSIADQLLQDKNHLWMHNWGISLDSYYSGLNRSLYQLWSLEAHMIRWTAAENPLDALRLLWEWILALLKSWYHFGVYVSHSVTLMFQGMSESSQNISSVNISSNISSIDDMYGISTFAMSKSKYSRLSGTNWIRLAPKGSSLYKAKMAVDTGDRETFFASVSQISEPWFRDEKAMVIAEYAGLYENLPQLNADVSSVNPGWLLYFGVPMICNVNSNVPLTEISNGGIIHDPDSPVSLDIYDIDQVLVYELRTADDTFHGSVAGETKSRRGRRLLENLYIARK